jgi:hypothetical protein
LNEARHPFTDVASLNVARHPFNVLLFSIYNPWVQRVSSFNVLTFHFDYGVTGFTVWLQRPINRQSVIVRLLNLTVPQYDLPQQNHIITYVYLVFQFLNLLCLRVIFKRKVLKRIKVKYEFGLYRPIQSNILINYFLLLAL